MNNFLVCVLCCICDILKNYLLFTSSPSDPLYQQFTEGSPTLWPRYFSESTLSHSCSNTCRGSPLSNHQLVIWDPLLSDLQWLSQPHLPALNTPAPL